MRRSRRERSTDTTAPAAHLVVPRGVDLRLLATVSYDDVRWLVEPAEADLARTSAPVGARYGGRFETGPTEAQLQLTGDLVVTGPLADEDAAPTLAKLDGSSPLRTAAETYRVPLAAVAWARAVARSHGGAVVTGTGAETRWVAEHLTMVRLFSPLRLAPAAAVEVLQGALPAAGLIWEAADEEPLRSSYAIRQDLSYDGAVLVRYDFATGRRPTMLAHADWREYGPHVHHIGWVPEGDRSVMPHDTGTTDNGTSAALRVTTWTPRVARVLRNAIGGIVLDRDGFPLDDAALTRS